MIGYDWMDTSYWILHYSFRYNYDPILDISLIDTIFNYYI